MKWISVINFLLMMALSPLLFGIINRTKAFFAGRKGQPLLQTYFDLDKLFRKGVVYSNTTTWVFRLAPVVSLAAVLGAGLMLPMHRGGAVISFPGDIIVVAYLLGLGRFMTVLGALDTGSSFEGMGASREVLFSALAEPAFLVGLAALARLTGSFSLTPIYAGLENVAWQSAASVLLLTGAAFLVVFLAENARIPVDDPNTHLELTMIHEVMVLDYSGPDLGMIVYGSGLKLWLLGMLVVRLVVPMSGEQWWLDTAMGLEGMAVLAVLVGIIESCMARLRMISVPQLLMGAIAFSVLAMVLVLR